MVEGWKWVGEGSKYDKDSVCGGFVVEIPHEEFSSVYDFALITCFCLERYQIERRKKMIVCLNELGLCVLVFINLP